MIVEGYYKIELYAEALKPMCRNTYIPMFLIERK